MKTLKLTAEVQLTEVQVKQILKTGKIVWDTDIPIAQIMGRDIKFFQAVLVDQSNHMASMPYRFF